MACPTDGESAAPRVDRQPVAGSCPRCDAEALRAYPVLSEGGWFRVTKCAVCLHSVSRERWTLLGPVRLTSAGLVLE
jgi:vanillate/4-hydroxybenzoate decarboxylase subunit D